MKALLPLAVVLCGVSLAGKTALADAPISINDAAIRGEEAPVKLSAFGFFDASGKPAAALIKYDLKSALFSDYAHKDRWIYVPAGAQAKIAGQELIDLPVGSAILKSFSYPDHNGGKPIETRLLLRRASGWVALPYVWEADGRDATLRLGGTRVAVSFADPSGKAQAIRYAVPNKNQCKECHQDGDAITPIGPKVRNLVMDPTVSPARLAAIFDQPAALGAIMPRWSDPTSGSLDARARAYLDINCAHCHNPTGSASNSGLVLRWGDRDPVKLGIGKRPVAAGRGSGGLDFSIAPGQPSQSILLYRLKSLEPGISMPEVGRSIEHAEASALIEQWITQMPAQ
jgi:uncharacterized repeat protein (TIGR03806 family)